MQVLQRSWDQTFSASSYGFRPGRSAHQAIARAQEHFAAGFRWVGDLYLEKFFDRVNHDKLMGQVARRVNDKRLLHLIRSWLKAGVMENGLVGPTDEGTPQGGPLSPLLSNLVLDQLDRELERRGHRFVRYADCNIYVRSRRAGHRLMEGLQTPRGKTQAKGKSGEKYCGTTVGAEVAWVQLYEWDKAKAAYCAQSRATVRGSNPSPYSSNSWRQYRDHGLRLGPLPTGMAGLFRLLPDTERAGPFQ